MTGLAWHCWQDPGVFQAQQREAGAGRPSRDGYGPIV